MIVSHGKTEYMSVNERETSGIVRLQRAEVVKMQAFKYLQLYRAAETVKEIKNRVQVR